MFHKVKSFALKANLEVDFLVVFAQKLRKIKEIDQELFKNPFLWLSRLILIACVITCLTSVVSFLTCLDIVLILPKKSHGGFHSPDCIDPMNGVTEEAEDRR